jgi:hypothetical protein
LLAPRAPDSAPPRESAPTIAAPTMVPTSSSSHRCSVLRVRVLRLGGDANGSTPPTALLSYRHLRHALSPPAAQTIFRGPKNMSCSKHFCLAGRCWEVTQVVIPSRVASPADCHRAPGDMTSMLVVSGGGKTRAAEAFYRLQTRRPPISY